MKLMPERNTLKEDWKRDIRTFRSLHGKDRLQFVYDYFRWYIVAGIVILFVLIVIGRILYEGQRDYRLRVCTVLNNETDISQIWFDDFIRELKTDGKEGDVEVNHDQPFDYSNQYYYLHELEVMTTISSYRMDVAICNEDMYSYLLALNACAPLDSFLPADLYQELDSQGVILHDTAGLQIQEDGSVDTTNAVDGFFGLNLSDTEFARIYDDNPEGKPLYGVIISNTDHTEDAAALVRALFSAPNESE